MKRIKLSNKLEKLKTLNTIPKYLKIVYPCNVLNNVLITKNKAKIFKKINLNGVNLIINLLLMFKTFINLFNKNKIIGLSIV
jgi:hypothetical protein